MYTWNYLSGNVKIVWSSWLYPNDRYISVHNSVYQHDTVPGIVCRVIV